MKRVWIAIDGHRVEWVDAAQAGHLLLGHAHTLAAIEEAVDAFVGLRGWHAGIGTFVVHVAVTASGELACLGAHEVGVGILDGLGHGIARWFGILGDGRVDHRLAVENGRVEIHVHVHVHLILVLVLVLILILILVAGAFVSEEQRVLRADLLSAAG